MKKSFLLLATIIPSIVYSNTIEGFDSSRGITRAEVVRPSGSTDTGALRTARKGVVIYDSGTSCNGAACDSGVLSTAGVEGLEIVVNNTGSTIRDLTITPYLEDGTTARGAFTRKVMFGSTPTGSSYATGMWRAYVGSSAGPTTVGSFVLFDGTSTANASQNTGGLGTEGCSGLYVVSACSSGTSTVLASEMLDDGTLLSIGYPAANQFSVITVGLGAGNAATLNGASGVGTWAYFPMAIPRRMQFSTTAAGTSNTVRLRVICYGSMPGVVVIPMVLPTKVKISLGTGTGNATLTVFGR